MTAAARRQRYRARKRAGAVCVVRVAVSYSQVLALIDAKYLESWDDDNHAAIEAALQRAWDDMTRDGDDVTGSGEAV